MDNLTHSLIGFSLAHMTPRFLRLGHPPPNEGNLKYRERAWYLVAILASNAPDLDVLLQLLPRQGDLGYLLHHRGHTHTLLGALGLGILIAELCFLGFRRFFHVREQKLSGRLKFWVWGVFCGFLHIGADYWNSYGVHPFWPWDLTWYYGDRIFIVEPLLLCVLLPMVVRETSFRVMRMFLGVLLLGFLALLLLRPEIQGLQKVLLTALLGAALGTRFHLGLARIFPVAWIMMVVGGFWWMGNEIEAELEHAQKSSYPTEVIRDISLTPAPANPYCWRAWVRTERDELWISREYLIQYGRTLLSHDRCFSRDPQKLAPVVLSGRDFQAREVQRLTTSIPAYRALLKESCRAFALAKFVRFPWISDPQSFEKVTDLRYDFASQENLRSQPGCQLLLPIPEWQTPPLRELHEQKSPKP